MIDIIAYFNYNNKGFIFANNNNKIEFYIKDRNNFISSLSKEDIIICHKILNSITIDTRNSVYLYDKRIGNNVYQIFYDIKTRLYWWNLLYGDKDKPEDNIELNFYYNNIPNIYNIDTQSSNTDRADPFKGKIIMLKRFIGSLLLPVLVSSSVSFLTINAIQMYRTYQYKMELIEQFDDDQIKTVEDLDRYLSETYMDELEKNADLLRDGVNSKQEYSWRSIEQAIESNSNLTQSEKEFLKKLKFFFDENHEYMNLDMIINRFKTFQITYSKGDSITNMMGDSVRGAYDTSLNHIYIPAATSFEETDLRIFIHETLHMFQIPFTGYAPELAVTIAQGEILEHLIQTGEVEAKEEYYDSNGALTNLTIGYPTEHKLMYLALKLMSPEARSQYLFQTDEQIIANELMRIDSSSNNAERQNRAYKLVDYLNHLNDNYDDTKETQTDEQCFKELQYYYNRKFGKPIEYDLDAVLAFYDDYDYTFTKPDGNRLVLIENVNIRSLNRYLGDYLYNTERSIQESLVDHSIDPNNNTITANPANMFLDLEKQATCYWRKNGRTVSEKIDQRIAKKYEKIIANRNAQKGNVR